MSILLNSSTMRSLVNSIMLGGPSHNFNTPHHPYSHHHHLSVDDSNHHHSKQNSFSSAEIMSTITESSNSSIDSGTFDVFDDPDDHFYDEPLLSNFDADDDDRKYRQPTSPRVTNIAVHDSPSVIESLLLDSSSSKHYKPLKENCQQPKNTSHLSQRQLLSSSPSSPNFTSTGLVINKPKIRPPKPPRHIKQLTGKQPIGSIQPIKSVSSTDLPLALPPKGVRSLSTSSASSSSGVSSSGSPSPSPSSPTLSPPFKLTRNNILQQSILLPPPSSSSLASVSPSKSPPPLPPPSISKKPDRPPPPVPDHPPKPLRKRKEPETVKDQKEVNGSLNVYISSSVNEVTINQISTSQSTNKESKTEESNKKISPRPRSPTGSTMAVLNRSRSSQGSFYETAFDSKAITHGDNLHRDQLSQHNQLHHNRQPTNQSTYHSNNQFHRPSEINSNVSSFIQDNVNSSRSSTASSTASSSSTGHESSSSTPNHLDQLTKSILPRRQGVKSSVHIPRSKSSDITLNLSAALNASSSPSSSPVNQIDTSSSKSSVSEAKATILTNVNQQSSEQFGRRSQRNKVGSLSTFSMVKSTTSDALSSLDCEAGRVLTRTRSNLDSLRLSIHERNSRVNHNNLNQTKEEIGNCESIDSNRNHVSVGDRRNNVSKVFASNGLSFSSSVSPNVAKNLNNLNNKSSIHSNSSILNNNNKVTVGDKLPANRSFRRLNLNLEDTQSSINLSSPKLQSPLTDTRPLDDYDTPWDSNQRLNKVFNKLINTPTSEKFGPDFFPNVNSPKVKTPSIESNPFNCMPTTTTINSNNTDGDNLNGTLNSNSSNCSSNSNSSNEERSTINTNRNDCNSSLRVEKIDDNSTIQLQSNQHRKGSNGSTHSSNSSYSLNGDGESNVIQSTSSSPVEPTKLDTNSKPERPRKLSLPLNLKSGNNNTNDANNSTGKSALRAGLNLKLDLCNSSGDSSSPSSSSAPSPSGLKLGLGPRKKPLLTFTGQPLPVVSEDIDTSLVLEKQGWYHGSITRLDAENLLRNMKEGSYLIRNCESTKQDYSLSLKSVKGFMHMKIVKQSDGKFVLGVFSKPFSSIPEMVKHYSINKLPIRGAEHMSLLYPVIDQLL